MYDYMQLTDSWKQAVLGGAIGAFVALGILFIIFVMTALYVYHSLAWMTIAKRMKFKDAWLSWIPIASEAMKLKIGKFHWAWIFLILVPILGWIALIVLLTISSWRVFDKLGHPGWFALFFAGIFIPGISWIGFVGYMIIVGRVAWGKR